MYYLKSNNFLNRLPRRVSLSPFDYGPAVIPPMTIYSEILDIGENTHNEDEKSIDFNQQ